MLTCGDRVQITLALREECERDHGATNRDKIHIKGKCYVFESHDSENISPHLSLSLLPLPFLVFLQDTSPSRSAHRWYSCCS